MKNKTPQIVIVTLAFLAASVMAKGAVQASFGEAVPTDNIITFYDPVAQDGLGWVNLDDSPNPAVIRNVGQSFITPGDSDYSMSAISMKLALAVSPSFGDASLFTIDFYALSAAGDLPTTGTFLSSQSGTMQPDTSGAPAGSFFTFTLDAPLTLDAGGIYAYVLSFPDTTDYNRIIIAISDGQPDPSGARVSQTNISTVYPETAVFYIQGTAIPEPSTAIFLGVAAFLLVFKLRKRVLPGNGAATSKK